MASFIKLVGKEENALLSTRGLACIHSLQLKILTCIDAKSLVDDDREFRKLKTLPFSMIL